MRRFIGGRVVLELTFIHEQHVFIALLQAFNHIGAFVWKHPSIHGAIFAEMLTELLLLVTVPVIIACFEVPTKVLVTVARQISSPERVVFVVWIIKEAAIHGSIAFEVSCKNISRACKVFRICLPILHASPIIIAHCI